MLLEDESNAGDGLGGTFVREDLEVPQNELFTGIVGKTFHENGECESVSPIVPCVCLKWQSSFGKVSHGITRFGITYPTFGLMILS